jgi:phospholipid-binding lipoprotein MlaA
VRDTVGEIVDTVMDPVHLLNYRFRTEISVSVAIARGLDQRVEAEGDLETLLSGAADPYATLRSTFLQARISEIRGDDATPPTLPDLDLPNLPSAPQAASGVSTNDLLASANDQAPSLQPLPDQQRRQSDGELAGALEKR